MLRRKFLSTAAVAVAGGSLAKGAAADPTAAGRDKRGFAVARTYRKRPDGQWYEIKRSELRPGDELILIGQDGPRLWLCTQLVATSYYQPSPEDAGQVMYQEEPVDLVKN